MNTCKTCKYWVDGSRGMECDFIDRPKGKANQFEIYISVADDTSLCYHLLTGPDFGCAHHLNKEETA